MTRPSSGSISGIASSKAEVRNNLIASSLNGSDWNHLLLTMNPFASVLKDSILFCPKYRLRPIQRTTISEVAVIAVFLWRLVERL